VTSPTEAEGGHSPHVPPAPPKARAKPFSFFWGTPKARQPLMSCLSPVTLSRAYKWN
jgi:hypothetical protein